MRALSYREAMAEKVRAALCRREVAIRDFFDVDHAVRGVGFKTQEPGVSRVAAAQARHSTHRPRSDLSDSRIGQLRRQLDAELRPVLREQEFAQFDLERAIGTVRAVAEALT